MRWDSPSVLAVAGTLAVHIMVVTAGDALVVTHPPRALIAAPHVELVEVEVPPVVKPPPPPVKAPEPVVEDRPAPRPRARAVPTQIRSAPPPPPVENTQVPPSGGDAVVHLDDIAPSATGVAVAAGKPVTGHIGRGGTGGGTGAGSGAGTGDEVARPVSVATIKTPAHPREGFDYLSTRDYPAEARALGIEGAIRVRLVVDDHGKVKSRLLLNKLGHGLDELAMQRAAEIEFEPAKDTEDKPVASVVVWTFRMELPK